MRHIAGSGVLLAASCALLLCACENPPPAGARGPTPPPPADSAEAESPNAEAPQTPATADGLDPTAPPVAPLAVQPAETESPPYAVVAGVFIADEPPRVREVRRTARRLELDTYNVRRLRIDRAQLQPEGRQSLTLVLDGQGMEWHAGSPVVEFERSRNGVWEPVRTDRDRP